MGLRETGFYWVKFHADCAWRPEYFNGKQWEIADKECGDTEYYLDVSIFDINETRILSPDEQFIQLAEKGLQQAKVNFNDANRERLDKFNLDYLMKLRAEQK